MTDTSIEKIRERLAVAKDLQDVSTGYDISINDYVAHVEALLSDRKDLVAAIRNYLELAIKVDERKINGKDVPRELWNARADAFDKLVELVKETK